MAFPFAPLCVCTQGGTGRTSSRPPELHECPSSHQCLSGCGSPHQCSLHTAAITLSPEPRKAPDGGFVSRPHLGAAAAACFPGCPLHPSLRPSGPALLSHQWYACLHETHLHQFKQTNFVPTGFTKQQKMGETCLQTAPRGQQRPNSTRRLNKGLWMSQDSCLMGV